MFLEILTPDKKIFAGEVGSVTVPGAQGAFQVLSNHAPIISTLEDGKLTVKINDRESVLYLIKGGVVDVLDNKVTVLVEGAEQLTE